MDTKPTNTLINLFETAVKNFPNNTFLMEKVGEQWQNTTFSQMQSLVYNFGSGLVKLGITPKDNIALLSEGRNNWIIAELAIFYAGAINVPLSIKLEERSDLIFRIQHSKSNYIIVSSGQLPKIRSIKNDLPQLKYIIVLDSLDTYQDKEISFDNVCKMGEEYLKDNKEEFLSIGASITNNDIATITYTSGTTADPKGIMLTHRNYTANVEQALTLTDIKEDWKTLIILPLDHCFAHVVGFYIFMHKGASIATVQTGKTPIETLKNIGINLKEIEPHLILSVPALAKNFRKAIEAGIKSKGKITESLFKLALNISYKYNKDGWNKGSGLTFTLKPFVKLFDSIMFSSIRNGFCPNLRFFIGGGALLDRDLQDFYYAIGIPMFQGYGLSEATPVISSNAPHKHKLGSSGALVKPLELTIRDSDGKILENGQQGEIVIKGENVMAGYWDNPISTSQTIKDGWLYTGDLGYMDNDGFLYVLGRFKSLLISSDGEKYSPEGIEEAIVSHSKYIDQIMLYNNQNGYTSALVYPNIDYLKKRCKSNWESIEGKKEAVRRIMNTINDFKNNGSQGGIFPERWLPATFAILDEPFSEKNQMINSTMKMVRPKIEKIYADRIAYMYTPEGKKIDNELNLKSL